MLGDGDRAGEWYSLIYPINNALIADSARLYALEPYIVAADVYSEPPHVGRGGWTWYTVCAGWMYRVGLDRVQGLPVQASELVPDPCIPCGWRGFGIAFRHATAHCGIHVENPVGVSHGIAHAQLGGVALSRSEARLRLVDDGKTHHLRVILGRPAS